MDATTIACTVFGCTMAGAWAGNWLGGVLSEHHLSEDTKNVVRLGSGFVATMAALVISLLVSSAKDSFDARSAELRDSSAEILLLDRVLEHYGPEAEPARDQIVVMTRACLSRFWPEPGASAPNFDPLSEGEPPIEVLDTLVRALKPATGAQSELRSEALDLLQDIAKIRWTLFEQYHQHSVPLPFLVVVTAWLGVLFLSFGLFAPRNAMSGAVLFTAGMSAAIAIFLIVEMEEPFVGVLALSKEPYIAALADLDRQ